MEENVNKARAEARAKLVKALRSGEYTQAKGVLCALDKETHKPIGHCCLGVAEELYLPWGGELNVWGGKVRGYDVAVYARPYPKKYEGMDPIQKVEGGLSQAAMAHYGFRTSAGEFEIDDALRKQFPKLEKARKGDGLSSYLTNLNDTWGWTFAEIADLIEAEPRGLFVS
jgi:hypothetical protein